MNSKETNKRISDTLSQLRQEVKNSIALQETQTPAPETDPEYEIKNYPRLLQLARAGLVPEDSLSKLTNVLKDPKRFGVSPKTRNQLYDLMIKTLNYIVISDPAAWARFRAFLMNEQTTELRLLSSIREYSTALQKNRLPIGEQKMDKIEKYKNLNEQANRLLRKEEKKTIQEQFHVAAEELVEALEDAQKLNALLRTGLVDSGKVARVRTALKDPEKAMANSSLRSDLVNMLMTLINVITSNPTAYSSVRKTLGKSDEPVVEELIGGQKKLDVNKNGKVDGADLAALRAGKKKVEDDEEIEEELIGGQKKLDVNKNNKIDSEDLKLLRSKKTNIEKGEIKEQKVIGKYQFSEYTTGGIKGWQLVVRGQNRGEAIGYLEKPSKKTDPYKLFYFKEIRGIQRTKLKASFYPAKETSIINLTKVEYAPSELLKAVAMWMDKHGQRMIGEWFKDRDIMEEEKEKWIQGAIKRPGALRKKLGIEKGETIPAGELEDISSELSAEAEGEKTLSKSDLQTLRQVNLAKTLRGMK